MKILLTLLMLGSVAQAGENDKDVLRDACGGIKAGTKRSQCFDALERITRPVAAPSSSAPEALKVSTRGLECEAYEFSELDSMPRGEVEGLHCSYALGSKISQDATDKQSAKYEENPRLQISLLERHIAFSQRCLKGMAKTREVFNRKFVGQKIDCSKMPERKPPVEPSAQTETPAT